jgi:cytochrome P450
MAVQPSSVSNLIPSIQETAESLVDQAIQKSLLSKGTIDMEDLCLKYTLEIACRHIIGLQDLPEEEVDLFQSQVKT